ncbi:hypothetical protein [Brucella inopinata]|uniref:Uncharacterized protein n=1 Tax=Brucella inopinata TaxID=1218315 RepID=A0AAW7B5U6_9HYPH|nr:hypothetical protein [Brucella inopinata]KEY04618.1 hypothetical protein IL59_0209490 [Brucella suis bv. 4 str. 40]MDL2334157.1 hypothetical protein [Brucella inopinata]
MFEEINSIIDDYDREKNLRARELYQKFFEILRALDLSAQGVREGSAEHVRVCNEMGKIAERLQALNEVVCQFEQEKVSEHASDCPPTYVYGRGVNLNDGGDEALLAWLREHFPQTWPREQP